MSGVLDCAKEAVMDQFTHQDGTAEQSARRQA